MFVPSQYSATSHTPAGVRHRAPWLPATWWQTPNVGSQVSTVQGFWSSQAGSLGLFFEHCRVTMQSEGSEFGCSDGKEHTSIRTPPVPASPGVKQQLVWASSVRQFVPLHLLAVWFGSPAKGSTAFPTTVHVDVQATDALFVQRSGLSLPHV